MNSNIKKLGYVLLSIFCLLTLYPVEWDTGLYKAQVLGTTLMVLLTIKILLTKDNNKK